MLLVWFPWVCKYIRFLIQKILLFCSVLFCSGKKSDNYCFSNNLLYKHGYHYISEHQMPYQSIFLQERDQQDEIEIEIEKLPKPPLHQLEVSFSYHTTPFPNVGRKGMLLRGGKHSPFARAPCDVEVDLQVRGGIFLLTSVVFLTCCSTCPFHLLWCVRCWSALFAG